MALMRWSPARELMNIQEEMNRLIHRFLGPGLLEETELPTPTTWYPLVDIKETGNEFIVTAELPGMNKNDIHITYKDGVLTLEGERKQAKEEKSVNFHRVERRYGKFYRTFQLPAMVQEDKIEAHYKDGILTVRLPKAEEAKAKEIEVKLS